MKSRLHKKLLAGVMLAAFIATNSISVAFAYGEYRPYIRSDAATVLDVDTDVKINNADSIVNLSLRDADITQVLRMFADQAGMNIIFLPSVEGTVTMDLVNIRLEKALDLVISTNELAYEIQDNTLIIGKDSDNLKTTKTKDLVIIPIKYISAASMVSFLNQNIFNKANSKPGISAKSVATMNPATNEVIIMGTKSDALLAQRVVEQFDKKPEITTFKVNHVTPLDMAALICGTLIPSMTKADSKKTGGAAPIEGLPTGFASDSSSGGGGGASGISIGGGMTACTYDQELKKVGGGGDSDKDGGITSLDLRSITISYFPALGTIQMIGGSQSQIDMVREYIAMTDKKPPQAYLEVQIIELNESGSKQLNNTWQFLSKNVSFNAASGTIAQHPLFLAGRSYDIFTKTDADKYEWKAGQQAYSGHPRLVYTINWLLSNQKGRVLSNPRILLTNGKESKIDLTSDYVAKVTSQYLDGSASGGAQVQKDYDIANDNGIQVTITPFISPDGYVTLDITPEYATVANQLTTPSKENPDERDIVATLLQRRNLDLKGIRIKDGETLVIGGMIEERETKDVTKIPILGDLPVVGALFRSTTTNRAKNEMVIMLTPQIIVDTEDAADVAL